MSSYLIGYDIEQDHKEEYSELYKAIDEISDGWWHCLDSTWIIKPKIPSARIIRAALTPHLRKGDKLLVVRLSGTGAWSGFSKVQSEWLKEYL